MFNPGFRSGTILNPFQFLLALEIKPAGFFLPRHPSKTNQSNSTSKDRDHCKAKGIQRFTQDSQGTHRQRATYGQRGLSSHEA